MPDPADVQPRTMTFLTFLRGLANEALIQFGSIPHPLTGERAVNLPYAAATVEILGILLDKSEGRRTPEEDEYLRTVVKSLGERLAKARSDQPGLP